MLYIWLFPWIHDQKEQELVLKLLNWRCNFWLIFTSCILGGLKPNPIWRPDFFGFWILSDSNKSWPAQAGWRGVWAAKGKIAVTASWEGRHTHTPWPWHPFQMFFCSKNHYLHCRVLYPSPRPKIHPYFNPIPFVHLSIAFNLLMLQQSDCCDNTIKVERGKGSAVDQY